MHTFFNTTTSRINCFALLAAAATVLFFSSWGTAPRRASLCQLAGEDAFHTTTSWHNLKINGKQLRYKATAGYVSVNDSNHHSAKLFYTAYTAVQGKRPVTFVFNGGPGSSSIWLHMGSFGPVRAVPGKAGYTDNRDTWLGFTDLVFIDPAGTGYSRPDDGTDARRFYGYHEDIRAIGRFIQQYLSENNRQNAPVFLAGESYGAARAVGLAAYLQDTLHTSLSGLTLISPALDYRLITFNKGNDDAYPYYLPAYAAAAQYHHQLAPQLQALNAALLNAKVSRFAFSAYSQFLKNGKNSAEVLDSLSYYTGIDKATLQALNGRLTDTRFTHLLLKNAHLQTGTYDSRISGNTNAADPSEALLRKTFPQSFQQYIAQNLAYNNRLPYLATIATPGWNYGPATSNGYLNVVPLLKNTLSKHPRLRVQVVSGTYDLATPPATVDTAVAAINASGVFNNRLQVHHYYAGHMLYTDDKANTQWKKDSENFYQKTISAQI
ncbi:alpha/beta hydrolase [Mucilaginibacter mali]|uniref:Alpha/beta hydrolase n=1 Tax=Mucilaginibacter mali TaxID=2740462 RepID=A0A7D4UN88_9SPHI|nr:alpha/beta hydrolase [Mucilaginibacter mali]QKJ31821.1 alpha/beta hydrolase [Mucilaginibacter mali]